MIIEQRAADVDERHQRQPRGRCPAQDQGAAKFVFARLVEPAFKPRRRADAEAERLCHRQHRIELGIGRAPAVDAELEAMKKAMKQDAQKEG